VDELTLVTSLRSGHPVPGADLDAPRRRLDAEIAAATAAPPAAAPPAPVQHAPARRRRWQSAAALTAAAATAIACIAVTQDRSGHPSPGAGTSAHPPTAILTGPASNGPQLVAFAVRAAAAGPAFDPQPHQWIYTKTLRASSSAGDGGILFGPPDKRVISTGWTRVDNKLAAHLRHGKLVVTHQADIPVSLMGWPGVTFPGEYRYIDALPDSAARLRAIIVANLKAQPGAVTGPGDQQIFKAIQALLENLVLPPRLRAGLYGVLVHLHGVHFVRSATDLAGRHGQGFYTVVEGYAKDEILINPRTFAYLGQQSVAIRAHTLHGSDGTRHISKGQLLGSDAVLSSGIVPAAGDVPAAASAG
jgi:hypothetical protein